MKNLFFITILMMVSIASAGPAYPLRVTPGQRYISDQNGNPFFIVGDSPWSLATEITSADVVTYLSDRASRGYNAIWMAAADNTYQTNPPDNYYGNPPFDGPDFTSEDPAYWAHLDYVIQQAANYGISVWLSPAFVGLTSADGYLASYQNSSDSVLTAYGAWLGNRYKNFPNIVWVLGGDADPTAAGLYQKIADIGNGIWSTDTNHLITLEASRFSNGQSAPDGGYSSVQAWLVAQGSVPSWLGLNWLYTAPPSIAANANTNYNLMTFLPPLLGEDWYEGSHTITEPGLRAEAYTSALSGAYGGRFFGNDDIWPFGNTNFDYPPAATWPAALSSEGSIEEAISGKLFYSREFWQLVPDMNNNVLTAGYQSGTTLAVAAKTSDGHTVIAYIPTQRTITLAMTNVSGTNAFAWWFNPQTGATTASGTYVTRGSQAFTPPDTNDWVLVLDDVSQNYPAPGIGNLQATNSLSIKALGNSVFQLAIAGAPIQVYTIQYKTNLTVPWQPLVNGTTDVTGTFLFNVVGTSNSVLYRAVNP